MNDSSESIDDADVPAVPDVLIGAITFGSGYGVYGYQPTGEPPYWVISYQGDEVSRKPSQWEATQEVKRLVRERRANTPDDDDETITLSEREK